MTNLQYYLREDHSARRRTTAMCVLAGLVIGLAMGEAGLSTNATAVACAAVVGAIELTRVLTYKRSLGRAQATTRTLASTRRRWLEGAIAAGIVVIISVLPFPVAEAAIIERRLNKALNSTPPDYTTVKKLMKFAVQNAIPLNKGKLNEARRKLVSAIAPSKPESSAASEGLASIEGYELYSATEEKLNLGSTVVVLPVGDYSFYAPAFIRSVSISGVSRDGSRILGHFMQSTEFPALFVADPAARADVLLAHMTGQSTTPLTDAPAFLTAEEKGRKFAVFDVCIKNLRQRLDGIIWANVAFENSSISYGGGMLELIDVTFKHCNFVADGPQAQTAVDFIRSQGEKSVTIRSAARE